MLKLKQRPALDVKEVEQAFLKNRKEWLEKQAVAEKPKPKLQLKPKHRKMRPAWHFLPKYGSGELDPGFVEMMARRGRDVYNPGLWLKHRLNLKKR